MHRRFLCLLALLLAMSLGACGVGSAPGGGDDDGDSGDSGDDGDDGGGGPAADAIPPDPILCATEYTVTGGDVSHLVTPGESCEGSGTWTITLGNPVPDTEYTGCSDAPADENFNLTVTSVGENLYEATDNEDDGRTWTVGMSDKAGSCSASFELDLGGGVAWAVGPSENGLDGPLHGTARFEKRGE